MKKSASFNVIVHYPITNEGREILARRVSNAQADFVINTIYELNCPDSQKQSLLDAVIDSARNEKGVKRVYSTEPIP